MPNVTQVTERGNNAYGVECMSSVMEIHLVKFRFLSSLTELNRLYYKHKCNIENIHFSQCGREQTVSLAFSKVMLM